MRCQKAVFELAGPGTRPARRSFKQEEQRRQEEEQERVMAGAAAAGGFGDRCALPAACPRAQQALAHRVAACSTCSRGNPAGGACWLAPGMAVPRGAEPRCAARRAARRLCPSDPTWRLLHPIRLGLSLPLMSAPVGLQGSWRARHGATGARPCAHQPGHGHGSHHHARGGCACSLAQSQPRRAGGCEGDGRCTATWGECSAMMLSSLISSLISSIKPKLIGLGSINPN